MPNDLAPLLDRIRTLAHEPANGNPERLLQTMEHTLTDGYAHALTLEAESIRVEREIGDAVAALGTDAPPTRLSELAGRLDSIERDLRALRRLLEGLKLRAEGVRRSA